MIVITHRKLCTRPFLEQVGLIAEAGPELIILREKDLPPEELADLAGSVVRICSEHYVPVSINTDFATARELGLARVHVPMDILRSNDLSDFSVVGASVHSPEEAEEAERLGADYLIAGHVFPTACKLNKEPRGTGFIKEVCSRVSVPVYGVGGITPGNRDSVLEAGARGVCVMSSAMTSDDPGSLVRSL